MLMNEQNSIDSIDICGRTGFSGFTQDWNRIVAVSRQEVMLSRAQRSQEAAEILGRASRLL